MPNTGAYTTQWRFYWLRNSRFPTAFPSVVWALETPSKSALRRFRSLLYSFTMTVLRLKVQQLQVHSFHTSQTFSCASESEIIHHGGCVTFMKWHIASKYTPRTLPKNRFPKRRVWELQSRCLKTDLLGHILFESTFPKHSLWRIRWLEDYTFLLQW